MRSVLALATAIGLALGGAVFGSPAAQAKGGPDDITIADDNLRAYLNDRLPGTRLPDQDITEAEAALFHGDVELTPATVSADIVSLQGLEHFTSMFDIQVMGKSITDLAPIIDLGLGEVYLADTAIESVPVGDWTELYLFNNASLTELDASAHSNLELLYFLGGSGADLLGLPSGLVWLNAGGYDWLNDGWPARWPFSDAAVLAAAADLEELLLINTSVSDITPLAGLTKLGNTVLAGNRILDLSPLPATAILGTAGSSDPRLDRANAQEAIVPSTTVNTAFANPVKDRDGTPLPVTADAATVAASGFVFDAASNSWSFTTPGTYTLNFANDPTDPSFSGTITQEVTTVVTVPSVTPDTPTISGTARVGEVLTADPGTWAPIGTTFTYQWRVNGAEVIGATGVTFTPPTAHVGADVTVEVTGSAPGYTSASATSDPVTVLPATVTPPVIPTAPPTPAPPTAPPTDVVEQEPILRVSVPRAEVGDSVTFVGDRFGAGEDVELVLHSDPMVLLTVRTSASGSFTQSVIVPSAPTGPHKVVGTGKATGLSASVDFEIVAPTSAGYRSDELAQTGAEPSLILFVIAGVLLVAGAGLGGAQLLTRRRIG